MIQFKLKAAAGKACLLGSLSAVFRGGAGEYGSGSGVGVNRRGEELTNEQWKRWECVQICWKFVQQVDIVWESFA